MSDYKQLIESIVITLLENGDSDMHKAFEYYCNIMGEKEYIKEDIQKFIRNEYRMINEDKKVESFDETKKMLGLIGYDRKQT
jgi:hypothetical protein